MNGTNRQSFVLVRARYLGSRKELITDILRRPGLKVVRRVLGSIGRTNQDARIWYLLSQQLEMNLRIALDSSRTGNTKLQRAPVLCADIEWELIVVIYRPHLKRQTNLSHVILAH